MLFRLLICAALWELTQAVVPADEIKQLPGWAGQLPSKQYSGLFTVPGTTRYYHYWFVESEGDPIADPVLFWFNGGPGSSSLYGYFNELGPFQLYNASLDGAGVPNLYYNEHTWAKFANLIFIESPAGVGFSGCNGTRGPINSCPDWNDALVASDNAAIVRQWYLHYPNFKHNQFFIAGESYAGIYVPTLVAALEKAQFPEVPKLTGFAVGDGCMGLGGFGGCNNDFLALFFEFMRNHGEMTDAQYSNVSQTCGPAFKNGSALVIPACNKSMHAANAQLGDYDIYDLYDTCQYADDERTTTTPYTGHASQADEQALHDLLAGLPGVGAAAADMLASIRRLSEAGSENVRKTFRGLRHKLFHVDERGHVTMNLRRLYVAAQQRMRRRAARLDPAHLRSAGAQTTSRPSLCDNTDATAIYFSDARVIEAIHVYTQPWTTWDNQWPKYTQSQPFLLPQYQEWVKKYRVMLYYGDTDPCVNYLGGLEIANALGLDTDGTYRPWTTDGKAWMGGHVQHYKVYTTPGDFTFATVRGAGHLVPLYKPYESAALMKAFLSNKPLANYTGPPGQIFTQA